MTRRAGLAVVVLCAALAACDPSAPFDGAAPRPDRSPDSLGMADGPAAVSTVPVSSPLSMAVGPRPLVAWASDGIVRFPDADVRDLVRHPGGVVHDVVLPVTSMRRWSDGYVVTLGTELHDRLVVLDSRSRQLSALSDEGLSIGAIDVDAAGHRLAYATQDARIVVDLRKPGVLVRQRYGVNDAGRPVGWVGDRVLFEAGDGAAGRAELWDWGSGRSRQLRPGYYWGAYDVSPIGEQVALRQGDGTCVEVSRLSESHPLWADCEAAGALFSPTGDRVLLATLGSGPARVWNAKTSESIDLPELGAPVVARGWESPTSVLFVVLEGDQVQPVRCDVVAVTCELAGVAVPGHSAAVVPHG